LGQHLSQPETLERGNPMKNYIQRGENLTLTAPADVNSGEGVLVGAMFGVAAGTVKSGDDVTLVRKGVFQLKKLAAQPWPVGAKVYWSKTDKECTTVASGNTLIGYAVSAAADPSATGVVVLS
jgi:predicted RecA/RadA family phage recombinase